MIATRSLSATRSIRATTDITKTFSRSVISDVTITPIAGIATETLTMDVIVVRGVFNSGNCITFLSSAKLIADFEDITKEVLKVVKAAFSYECGSVIFEVTVPLRNLTESSRLTKLTESGDFESELDSKLRETKNRDLLNTLGLLTNDIPIPTPMTPTDDQLDTSLIILVIVGSFFAATLVALFLWRAYRMSRRKSQLPT